MDKHLPVFCLRFGGISTGIQIHHHVQDYKRSSSCNIDHGSVETETFTQPTIASRSFRVVYQSHFQFFLNLFSTLTRKKKKREKQGVPSYGIIGFPPLDPRTSGPRMKQFPAADSTRIAGVAHPVSASGP